MKKFLAIAACKLGRAVGRLIGRGSSFPGKVALKICPDILSRIKMPKYIIAVSGSNGKTSTVEMIAAVLRKAGRRVAYNAEGSNQIEGVTTLVLGDSTLGGVARSDVLLIESDERYAAHSFKYFTPTHFVITNLYRDQLTRNGHPEWVYDALLPALGNETHLILNADDPLSSCFADGKSGVVWYGVNECSFSAKEPSGVYHDGAYCPKCKAPMSYKWYQYNQIGSFECSSCGHRRQEPKYAVTSAKLGTGGSMTINGTLEIKLAFGSIYNIYNCLAAYAACAEVGVEPGVIAGVIDSYILKNGRRVSFTLGARSGMLLTSKHENSIGYDTNLRYIRDSGGECTVMIIVDAVSRKYFTGETSWLWDIDFDMLAGESVKKVLLCGKYVNDLAVRFEYSRVPQQKLELHRDIAEAAASLRASGDEPVYVVTCFSDKDKILAEVER